MRGAKNTWWAWAAVAIVAAAFSLPAIAGADLTDIPAKVAVFNPPVSSATYPGVDYGKSTSAKDDRYSKTSWRVVERTGNCCETYLTTTPGGRLLDFGGSYINYSDDRGLTWRQVQPLVPLVNGEGAIVAAPGGDVLGVEWDPYSGDHLQFYKFEADTGQWLYTEMPVHSPFYDREWISVLPGPVTINGLTYEYVSFVKGGVPWKEPWFYSTDGLHYAAVTSKGLESILGATPTQAPLAISPGALNDWVQPNTGSGMTPLGKTNALAGADLVAEWALLNGKTFTWSPFTFPGGAAPNGLFQVDSAGRLHNVIPSSNGKSFDYRISSDGGQTWKSITVSLPKNHAIEEIDFRVNRAVGVAAVAMRAQDQGTGNDQDLVFKLDVTKDTAFLKRMYEVGLGDVGATAGVGNDIRFDFESVTIFPDGRVGVSFLDSTTTGLNAAGAERITPALAIEGDTTLGGKIPAVQEVTPALGTPYVSYRFDASDEGWTASGVPIWTRSAPGTKTGTDDPTTQSFGFDATQYGDLMEGSLTSPAVTTDPGLSVVQFWLKTDTENGFDYVNVEWSSDGGSTWQLLGQYSGQNAGFPNWAKVTLGFDSPGGAIQVRFRFASDELCSALDHLCSDMTGDRVDEVVIGKQA
jgi:hypothetical protein